VSETVKISWILSTVRQNGRA